MSYYCCYFKARHPLEFAAATLDYQDSPEKQILFLRELEAEGIGYVPFDFDHSTDCWQVKQKDGNSVLLGPLTNVKGIGAKAQDEIITARKNKQPVREALAKRIKTAQTEIDSLYPIQRKIDELCPDLNAVGIVTKPMKTDAVKCGVHGTALCIGVVDGIKTKDHAKIASDNNQSLRDPHNRFSIGFWLTDDTGKIYCSINRYNHSKWSKGFLDQIRKGKTIMAVKGKVPNGFKMLDVTNFKRIGEMDE